MARPRTHGEPTRVALLDAAERIIAEAGPHALSVRTLAADVGTSTRAVYSLFGSKGALLAALAKLAFEFLRDQLDVLPETRNPEQDLVSCGVGVYRRLVLERPSLYRIAFQRVIPGLEVTDDLRAAREEALGRLVHRVERVAEAHGLGQRSPHTAAVQFNAMCEGLANAELRGGTLGILPAGGEEQAWREAFETLVHGLIDGAPATPKASGSSEPP